MRYSIDWKRYNERLRSCGRHKAMGRFPTALLRHKANQLLLDYVRICCIAGNRSCGEGNRSCGLTIDWKWAQKAAM